MGTDQVVTSLVADWGIFQRQGSNLGASGLRSATDWSLRGLGSATD
jgi:hypothetical protein